MKGESVNHNIPCYECKNRELGCHDRCEAYLKYRAEKDRTNELIRVCKSVAYNKHFV